MRTLRPTLNVPDFAPTPAHKTTNSPPVRDYDVTCPLVHLAALLVVRHESETGKPWKRKKTRTMPSPSRPRMLDPTRGASPQSA
jgi:hypothetical protein